jgi:hypothetical protein
MVLVAIEWAEFKVVGGVEGERESREGGQGAGVYQLSSPWEILLGNDANFAFTWYFTY